MKRKALIILVLLLVAVSLLPLLARTFIYPLKYRQIIAREAKRNHLDPNLLAAVILQESRFNPDSVSSAGAVGLMQVMPGTAQSLRQGEPALSREELRQPATNIALGTRYLAYLRRKYGDDRLALAAYNGGAANLNSWLRKRADSDIDRLIASIPFTETRSFVRTVSKNREVYRTMYPDAFKVEEGY